MPLRPPTLCLGGCGERDRFARGRGPKCALKVEQRRGSASSRGYESDWKVFQAPFRSMLSEAGIAPICGAAMPDGPRTNDSECTAASYGRPSIS